MKLNAIICLFLISLLSCFILGSCDKNHDKDKEVFTQEDLFFAASETDLIASYVDFKDAEESLKNSSFITDNQVFFYLINTEAFGLLNHGAYTPPSYSLYKFSNEQNNDIYLVSIFHSRVYDENAPQRVNCGNTAGGLPRRNCLYQYVAYPTNDINADLTFKHAIFSSTTKLADRLILIYQNDTLIAFFHYYATVPDDSYYEQFVKDNLVIVGVNTNET